MIIKYKLSFFKVFIFQFVFLVKKAECLLTKMFRGNPILNFRGKEILKKVRK
mgnify:CR=1 FL=1